MARTLRLYKTQGVVSTPPPCPQNSSDVSTLHYIGMNFSLRCHISELHLGATAQLLSPFKSFYLKEVKWPFPPLHSWYLTQESRGSDISGLL